MSDIVIIATTVTEMGSYYRKFGYGQAYRIGHRSDDGDRSGCVNLSGALNQSALRR
jgi:hypothetical protein